MDYKWKIYICERCQCYFALDRSNEPQLICCPNCANDDEITATGECLSSVIYPDIDDGEVDKTNCKHLHTETTHPYGWIACKDCGKLLG